MLVLLNPVAGDHEYDVAPVANNERELPEQIAVFVVTVNGTLCVMLKAALL
jgi:hypothetical protein